MLTVLLKSLEESDWKPCSGDIGDMNVERVQSRGRGDARPIRLYGIQLDGDTYLITSSSDLTILLAVCENCLWCWKSSRRCMYVMLILMLCIRLVE